jgi:purine-binding chemotaxis protein CheW
MQFCTFFLNQIYFGIDVMQVQEVIRYQETTPIPLAANDIKGLINLRGQIITVIELKRRLSMNNEATTDEQTSFNIILENDSQPVSLLVDKMGDVIEVDHRDIEPTPSTLKGKISQMLQGAYKFQNEFLLILDIEKILVNP